MSMKGFGKYLVWAIPNREDLEKNLEEKVYAIEYDGMGQEHREFLEKFVIAHNLDHKGRGKGHVDYAMTLAENGITVGMNSGIKIDGKYSSMIFLNENLSEYQVEVLESQRDVFDKEFHHSFSLFPVMVYSSDAVDYRSISPNLRDLNIEAIIHQNPDYFDGQKLLYQHLSRICSRGFKR